MGPIPEEFSELRRLLALKRREQPPPGYFNTFAGKVIARIEADRLAQPRSWWARLLAPSEWTPALAGANTAIFAGLAVMGGTALVFKNRLDRGNSAVSPNPITPVGFDAASSPTSSSASPQYAGVFPENLLSVARSGWMQLQPASQFQIHQPSVRERLERVDDGKVPAGIFEPWNQRSFTFPTSIVNYVDAPR